MVVRIEGGERGEENRGEKGEGEGRERGGGEGREGEAKLGSQKPKGM